MSLRGFPEGPQLLMFLSSLAGGARAAQKNATGQQERASESDDSPRPGAPIHHCEKTSNLACLCGGV